MSDHTAQLEITPGTGADGQPESEHYNATITYWKDVNHELAVFRVTPDTGEAPPFKAGQFATLGLPREHEPIHADDDFPSGDPKWKKLAKRPYSVSSSQHERGYAEFFIVLNPPGKMTPKLWRIKEGGRVHLGPKITGEFNIECIPPGKDVVMVSTGTGLSPFMAMLRTHAGTGRWRRCIVISGARYARDIGYRDELGAMAAEHEDITYVPAVTREPEDSDWNGFRGRVNTILEDDVYDRLIGYPLRPETAHVMLCGNPVMINEAEELLTKRGWVTHSRKQVGNLHFERFW